MNPETIINLIKTIIYGFLIFLDIDTSIAEILYYVIITDMVLGVIKSITLYDKRQLVLKSREYQDRKTFSTLTSLLKVYKGRFSIKKLLYGFITKISLLAIPIIIALGAKGIGLNLTWAVNLTIKILIANEVISSLTNIQSIRTRKNIVNEDYITKLLERLREFIGGYITTGIENINKTKDNEGNKDN